MSNLNDLAYGIEGAFYHGPNGNSINSFTLKKILEKFKGVTLDENLLKDFAFEIGPFSIVSSKTMADIPAYMREGKVYDMDHEESLLRKKMPEMFNVCEVLVDQEEIVKRIIMSRVEEGKMYKYECLCYENGYIHMEKSQIEE